ncbi:hypothetical protein [Mucilaginibacter pineti]|uniref:hypothetical protein n=1 Tax=Mucilaginibacter pineti TaxID=1391627 RepID=UPI00115FCF66|nr:hypothetical protein [Mucilaginibacter pineti]
MKTFVIFCFICVVSTGALLAGIDMKNSGFGIPIAATVWLVFVLYVAARRKRNRIKKEREQLFNEWFGQQYRRRSF